MPTPWPFSEPPETRAFVDPPILEGRESIHVVCHDERDGAWRFLCLSATTETRDVGAHSDLATVLALDPTVASISNMPPGWMAFRNAPGAPWVRQRPNSPHVPNWQALLRAPEVFRITTPPVSLVLLSVAQDWWHVELEIHGDRIMLGGNTPRRLLDSLTEALGPVIATTWRHGDLDLGHGFALSDPYTSMYFADSGGKRLLKFQDVKAAFFATIALSPDDREAWLRAVTDFRTALTRGVGHRVDRREIVKKWVAHQASELRLSDERHLRKRLSQEGHLRWIALLAAGMSGAVISNWSTAVLAVPPDYLTWTLAALTGSTLACCLALWFSVAQFHIGDQVNLDGIAFYQWLEVEQSIRPLDLMELTPQSYHELKQSIDEALGKATLSKWKGFQNSLWRGLYRYMYNLAMLLFGAAFVPAMIGLWSR